VWPSEVAAYIVRTVVLENLSLRQDATSERVIGTEEGQIKKYHGEMDNAKYIYNTNNSLPSSQTSYLQYEC